MESIVTMINEVGISVSCFAFMMYMLLVPIKDCTESNNKLCEVVVENTTIIKTLGDKI